MPCIDITSNNDLVITQYGYSPKLKGVISGFTSLMQSNQLDTLCKFEKGLAIDNAFGWLLDRLGDNFGFKRPAIPSVSSLYFGFDQGGTNFDRAPFYYGTKEPLVPVGDVLYKKLLKIWIRGLFYDGSVYEANQILTDVLGKGYITDNEDQTANIVVYNIDELTAQALLITNVIPKVAGVRYSELQLVVDAVPPFGFGYVGFGANAFVKTFNIKDYI
jgi:hypothetical protein